MSADTLRAAARVLRERAHAASRAPWTSYIEGRDHKGGDSIISTNERVALENVVSHDTPGDIYVSVGASYHSLWEEDQDYIASMDPLVGFHLADLFDAEASAWEAAVRGTYNASWLGSRFGPVVNVARAYLGLETPTPAGRLGRIGGAS